MCASAGTVVTRVAGSGSIHTHAHTHIHHTPPEDTVRRKEGKKEKRRATAVCTFSFPCLNCDCMRTGVGSHGGERKQVPRPFGEGVGDGDREAKVDREEGRGRPAKEALVGAVEGGF